MPCHLPKNAAVIVPAVYFLEASLEVSVIQGLVVLVPEGVLQDVGRQHVGAFGCDALQLLVRCHL